MGLTKLQAEVLQAIKDSPGEDAGFVCYGWLSPQTFGRVAHTLMKMGLVYYYDNTSQGYREWWPVREENDA